MRVVFFVAFVMTVGAAGLTGINPVAAVHGSSLGQFGAATIHLTPLEGY